MSTNYDDFPNWRATVRYVSFGFVVINAVGFAIASMLSNKPWEDKTKLAILGTMVVVAAVYAPMNAVRDHARMRKTFEARIGFWPSLFALVYMLCWGAFTVWIFLPLLRR